MPGVPVCLRVAVCVMCVVYEPYYIDVLIPGCYCKQALVVGQVFFMPMPSCSWTPDPEASAAAWMRLIRGIGQNMSCTVDDFA